MRNKVIKMLLGEFYSSDSKSIVIQCETEREAYDLFKALDDIGVKWKGIFGSSLSFSSKDEKVYRTQYWVNGENTCYRLSKDEGLSYAHKAYYEKCNVDVIVLSDIVDNATEDNILSGDNILFTESDPISIFLDGYKRKELGADGSEIKH